MKKNAFDPDMMLQLSNALTELHNNPELWVGVITAEGDNFTAGLDMPSFNAYEPNTNPETNINAFGLGNSRKKPIITAVQGICFTIGIEMALAGDIIVAATTHAFADGGGSRYARWVALIFAT